MPSNHQGDMNDTPSSSDHRQTAQVKPKPTPLKPDHQPLPQWKVLLHNDDVNEVLYVIETVVLLTPLDQPQAQHRTLDAHNHGIALLLTTHQERAELYRDQFASRKLTVTIEPTQ